MMHINDWSLEKALSRWVFWCWVESFPPAFVRTCFICVDDANMENKGVMLTKVDCDGDISEGEEKVREINLNGAYDVWRVPIKEPCLTSKDVVEGKKEWECKKPE